MSDEHYCECGHSAETHRVQRTQCDDVDCECSMYEPDKRAEAAEQYPSSAGRPLSSNSSNMADALEALRLAEKQIDDYREALMEAEDGLADGTEPDDVRTGIHLALRRKEYVGDRIRATISRCSSPETRAVVPETLVVWVAADYWRCRCKPPGDINHRNSYQCRDCCTIRPEKAPAQKASEHRHGAAQDFVEYDPEGGVRIDMARYLRSPAGQAQLQELDGQNANSCVCGEPNSPGTHRTDGPCLAPIGDHHP